VENHGLVHLSAGDLLRAERDSGSPNGDLINNIIKEGKIVPVEITCGLIKKAMEQAGWESKKYLVDGFPRNEDNYSGWVNTMSESAEVAAVLWFDADEEEMTKRILKRAETSGRNDDNIETLRKRFAQFKEEQMPIIEKFAA
jgi:UMP-CMP kinase